MNIPKWLEELEETARAVKFPIYEEDILEPEDLEVWKAYNRLTSPAHVLALCKLVRELYEYVNDYHGVGCVANNKSKVQHAYQRGPEIKE